MLSAGRSQLLAEVTSMVPNRGDEHVLVAVDGVDGAGKSLFAAALAQCIRVAGRPVIEASVDGFHQPKAVRYGRGRDSPTGFWLDSYDYAALRSSLIDPLAPGGSGCYRCATHDVSTDALLSLPWLRAEPGSVLVLDGLFLHRSELRGFWDFSLFLEVPSRISVPRLALRDGSHPDPEHPSNRRYVEAHRIYCAESAPRSHASIVIDNSDVERPELL